MKMKKLILTLTIFGLVFAPGFARAEEEIAHGGIISVNLTNLSAKVKAGESFALTLMAEDKEGNTWDVSEYALFLVNDPRGMIEKNIYLPGKIGTWEIEAAYGNYSSETKIEVVPGTVSRIEINPNSQPEIINLNEKKTFNATAFDKMNNLVEAAEFIWSQQGELGEIDQVGVFEATDTGLGHVIATSGNVSATIEIEVREKTTLPALTPETENTSPANANPAVPSPEENEESADQKEEGQVAGLETAQAEETNLEKEETKNLTWYWWLMILIAYLAVMILYYFAVKKSKSGWWWFFPLVLTIAAFWIYFEYSGNAHGWWPWVAIIMALLITLFRPKKFFEEPKEPTF